MLVVECRYRNGGSIWLVPERMIYQAGPRDNLNVCTAGSGKPVEWVRDEGLVDRIVVYLNGNIQKEYVW